MYCGLTVLKRLTERFSTRDLSRYILHILYTHVVHLFYRLAHFGTLYFTSRYPRSRPPDYFHNRNTRLVVLRAVRALRKQISRCFQAFAVCGALVVASLLGSCAARGLFGVSIIYNIRYAATGPYDSRRPCCVQTFLPRGPAFYF